MLLTFLPWGNLQRQLAFDEDVCYKRIAATLQQLDKPHKDFATSKEIAVAEVT